MNVSEIYEHLYFPEPWATEARKSIEFLHNKYEFLGIGLYRVVFKMKGNTVFKFPLGDSGEYCNDGEGSIFHETLAKGRWLKFRGFVCVMQEFVVETTDDEIIARYGEIPDWVGSVDCGQVGFAKDGTLKAFDYVHP